MTKFLFGLAVVFSLALIVWASNTLKGEYTQESEEKRAKERDQEYKRG